MLRFFKATVWPEENTSIASRFNNLCSVFYHFSLKFPTESWWVWKQGGDSHGGGGTGWRRSALAVSEAGLPQVRQAVQLPAAGGADRSAFHTIPRGQGQHAPGPDGLPNLHQVIIVFISVMRSRFVSAIGVLIMFFLNHIKRIHSDISRTLFSADIFYCKKGGAILIKDSNYIVYMLHKAIQFYVYRCVKRFIKNHIFDRHTVVLFSGNSGEALFAVL